MTLLVVNQGEQIALEALLNKTAPQDLDLRLFQSDTTPSETHTEDDYTEADFTGYAAIQLTAASWSVTPGAPTEAVYAQQTFTSSAGSQDQDVYGYYVTQRSSGKMVYVERFSDGPYNIANNGDVIKVTPKITAN
jgi:hypothetical protein